MAKGKRASLKDKDSDSLGLTQRKGKGIDLLFGGPTSTQEADTASGAGSEDELAGLVDTSLSGTTTSGDRMVDELGLPVAMEEPPDDLIPASSSPAEAVSDLGGKDAVDPSTSPFAMPTTETLQGSDTGDVNDLSGIVAEDVSPVAKEEDNLSSSLQENDLSGIVDNSPSPGSVPGADLSGIAGDDLSDMIVEDSPGGQSGVTPTPPPVATTTTPTSDPSSGGLSSGAVESPVTPPPITPPPVTSPPPTLPTTTAAPINVQPTTTPQPTPTPMTAPVTLDTFGGVVTGAIPVSEEAILPEDALTKQGDHILVVKRSSDPEPDAATIQKVQRYIGNERIARLDQEIENFYDRVADELSSNKRDAEDAIEKLAEAQDIIFYAPYRYAQALMLVSAVRTALIRKRNLRKWSYTWGLFVFFYGIVWLAAFIAGFFLPIANISDLAQGSTNNAILGIIAIRAAWLSSLAGGIGGIVAILYSVSWRVAIKHEFDRQYIMKYLVQPVMGFLLGAVIFFITGAGFLFFGGSGENILTDNTKSFLGVNQVIAIQMVLGFIAGFRQRVVYYMIDKIVERLSPTVTEDKRPTSVIPQTDDIARLQEAEEAGTS